MKKKQIDAVLQSYLNDEELRDTHPAPPGAVSEQFDPGKLEAMTRSQMVVLAHSVLSNRAERAWFDRQASLCNSHGELVALMGIVKDRIAK